MSAQRGALSLAGGRFSRYAGFVRTIRAYYDYAINIDEPFQAAIVGRRAAAGGAALVLDKTLFYPEGGGQPCDLGTINGCRVLDVQERDGEILHYIEGGAGAASLVEGAAVTLRLDAARRRDLTAQHTGQHLLSGTLLKMSGFPTLSMHSGTEICTIDVDAPALPPEMLVRVEEAVADAIERDSPVITHLCPPEDLLSFPLRKRPPQGEEVIRVVEIQGADFSPCCGTHALSTGQLGCLRVLGAERYKNLTRVSFLVGRRALRHSRRIWEAAQAVSRLYSVPPDEIAEGAKRALEKTGRVEEELKALREERAASLAQQMLGSSPLAGEGGRGRFFTACFDDMDIEAVTDFAREAQKRTAAVVVAASLKDRKAVAVCADKGTDIRPALKAALENCGGKGGGGPSFFNALFAAPQSLEAFLKSFNKGGQDA